MARLRPEPSVRPDVAGVLHLFMHSIHRRHLFIALLLLFTLAVNASVAFFNIRRLDNNGRTVARTYLVLAQLDDLLSLVDEISTQQRTFVTTGDELALEPFRATEAQLTTTLGNLERNVSSDARKKEIPPLKAAIRNRIALARLAIQTRREKGAAAAQAFIKKRSGKGEREQILRYVGLIQSREQDVLQERADESTQSAQDATRTFWIASGANICLLLLVSGLLWRASRQNAELEGAYAGLKRAESMRDGLSAMLVHDLRTPLTTLLGPLHMLQEGSLGPLDDTQREIVAMSQTSGERLLELINELLDVSKMEAGEMRIQLRKIDVASLVQAATKEVVRLENVQSPRIVSEIEPGTSVIGDYDLLLRVLINLLGNSLKFTSFDGQINVGARNKDEETLFWVRDTGEGIAAEDLGKIFDKFGQAEARQAGRKLSTGLGLTFCKLTVEAHGGKIWVESQIGQGSTFFFSIPFPKTN
jgi:signal transduction histidine kinase